MPDNFPSDWRNEPCFLVAIRKPLIPYVGGLLKMMEQRGFWLTETDYENGYTAVVQLEAQLMQNCIDEITNRQDSLYRLIDTSVYGRVYEVTSTDPLVIEPAIPLVPVNNIQSLESLMGRAELSLQLIDNSLNGTETEHYDNPPSIRDKLQEVIDAITAGSTDNAGIIDQLVLIVGALA